MAWARPLVATVTVIASAGTIRDRSIVSGAGGGMPGNRRSLALSRSVSEWERARRRGNPRASVRGRSGGSGGLAAIHSLGSPPSEEVRESTSHVEHNNAGAHHRRRHDSRSSDLRSLQGAGAGLDREVRGPLHHSGSHRYDARRLLEARAIRHARVPNGGERASLVELTGVRAGKGPAPRECANRNAARGGTILRSGGILSRNRVSSRTVPFYRDG